ncbi:unnamed protein product [Ectocarpus sp. 4 AP-2014]
MYSGGGAVELIPADEFSYWNFFLDWGPLSLGNLFRFCRTLNFKLANERRLGKAVYVYSGTHAHKRTNAAFLLTAWLLLYGDRTPEQAFAPFQDVFPPFPPFHDASPCVCTFDLFIPHCLKGLQKARHFSFFNLDTFDVEEYEHYEQVENGDLNWLVDGKFLAFAGPHSRSEMTREGYRTLTPRNYIPYFKKHNVTLVVRLNKKYYDEGLFLDAGIDHLEAYFLDGSVPPPSVIRQFIAACEATPGAVAVHCKAGLGRTGTCIGCYIMKHYSFTAAEVIGWMRICRPGSVIGPQQHYLEQMEGPMHREGFAFRQRAGSCTSTRRASGVLPARREDHGERRAEQARSAAAAEAQAEGTRAARGSNNERQAARESGMARQRGGKSRSSVAGGSFGRSPPSRDPRLLACSLRPCEGGAVQGKGSPRKEEGTSTRRSNLDPDEQVARFGNTTTNSRSNTRRISIGQRQQASPLSPLKTGDRVERRGESARGAYERMATTQRARQTGLRRASAPCGRAVGKSATAMSVAAMVEEETAAASAAAMVVAPNNRTSLDAWGDVAAAGQRKGGKGAEAGGWALGEITQGDLLRQQRSRR